jgi:pimeloyl-ACP methyl ester carboxylesterase
VPEGERHLAVTTGAGREHIALLQHGEGTPWVVAWHGLGVDNRLSGWELVLPAKAGNSILCAGLPGHGGVGGDGFHEAGPARAAHPAWSPGSFMETGEGVLRAVAEESGAPVYVAGSSLGAVPALGAVLRAPELVAGLILLSPLVWGTVGGLLRLWSWLSVRPALCRRVIGLSLLPGRRSARLAELTCRPLVADWAAFMHDAGARGVVRRHHGQARTGPAAITASLRVVQRVDMRPALLAAPARAPTLVLHGTRDRIVPYEQGRWLAAHLPGARLQPLPRVGHLPQAECAALVARAIRDWLREQQGARGA